MIKKEYDPSDAASIYAYSGRLLNNTLAEVVSAMNPSLSPDKMIRKGKGALGILVEEYFFGYKPNSDTRPDFPLAGVELKVTPLKNGKKQLLIKERLVIDMINYCTVVNQKFEDSLLYKKFLLMLIIFYLHESGKEWKDMKFYYSVLWSIKEKDLEIIRQDYEKIIYKIKAGLAHELSESDTYYLAACTKGQDNTSLRNQPFNDVPAKSRAFSLKVSYMRTILGFVQESDSNMATNTSVTPKLKSLVTTEELKSTTFEEILINRFKPYYGKDYKEIAEKFGMRINPCEKSKYARVAHRILHNGLHKFDEAEEIKKAGIIAKTIRIESNGRIKEHMSFENINYDEVHETEDWTDSRWYEIVNSRMMLIVFRREDCDSPEWHDEKRYVLDKIVFTSLPNEVKEEAKEYWENIKVNVERDTFRDADEGFPANKVNTFWKLSNHHNFHVRPKGRNAADVTESPISGEQVRKKCYWLDNRYLSHILQLAYGSEWNTKFNNNG